MKGVISNRFMKEREEIHPFFPMNVKSVRLLLPSQCDKCSLASFFESSFYGGLNWLYIYSTSTLIFRRSSF
nr:hypothetical protein Q903MT_gene382 [Picea sitchensis]